MFVEDFSTKNSEESLSESSASLLCRCAYDELNAGDKPVTTPKDEPQFIAFNNGQAEKAKITQDSIDSYIKSFENLQKNGAANKETLDAFKDACKSLKDLDEAGLKKALQGAAKNPKVEMMLVAMHLKEVLQTNGFKNISGDFKRAEGGFVMKHDDSETYISMTYSPKGVGLQIEQKK